MLLSNMYKERNSTDETLFGFVHGGSTRSEDGFHPLNSLYYLRRGLMERKKILS